MTGNDQQTNTPEPGQPRPGKRRFTLPVPLDWKRRSAAVTTRVVSFIKRSPQPAASRPAGAVKPARQLRIPFIGSSGRGNGWPPGRNKGLKSHWWRVPYFLEHLALAEQAWGGMRLFGALVAIAVFIFISWQLGGSSYPLLSVRGLRHMIFPLAAFLGAFLVAGHYLRDIYELPKTRLALRYLFSTVFGYFYPVLRIANGVREIPPGEINLVDTIGGPGFLNVQPGNAVLCERMTEPAAVFGGGFHFLTRFETVKEIVSLQDQHGHIEQTTATTRDGIEVKVKEIHYRYRVRNGRRYGDYNRRTPEQPYPFSMQAIRNLTYNRNVSSSGIASWHNTVQTAVSSVITDYVQKVGFDKLSSPSYEDPDPRKWINTRLEQRELRERLKRTGAELLWCDIGRFDPPEKVDDTHVGFWAVPWTGKAMVQRAHGEANALFLQEYGRAEAQADLLKSIHHALADLNLSPRHHENLRKLILMRTAEILESMADPSRALGKGEPPKLSLPGTD